MESNPFTLSPNPTLFYLTPSLKASVAKIRFVLDYRQGLTAVLGDVGMGKSTLLRLIHLDYSVEGNCATALIPSPNFPSEFALLKGICKELGVAPKRSMTDQEDELRSFLFDQLEAKRNCIVFLDEAQRLTTKMLELVRTLLNLETNEQKMIQIVLCGQLELRDRLRDPSRKALRSRVLTPSLLDHLSPDECAEMIAFRCDKADIPNTFEPQAVTDIYTASGGVPRDALKLASVAWQASKATKSAAVTSDHVEIAVDSESVI